MKKILEDINSLINDSWETMEGYYINEEQKEFLLNNKSLIHQYIMFNKGNIWEEHAHTNPQLLLVIRGKLTHVVNNKEYIQETNDLLVVPKNV